MAAGDGGRQADRAGLKAASDSFARSMKNVASKRTQRTAEAVNVKEEGDVWQIRGGQPGGQWGWDPIVALMFDNNLAHPLFGDRKHWYKQGDHKGRWPITEYTVRAGIDNAVNAYADAFIQQFASDYGFDDD